MSNTLLTSWATTSFSKHEVKPHWPPFYHSPSIHSYDYIHCQPSLLCKTAHFLVQFNRSITGAHTLSCIQSNTPQIILSNRFFSYHLCGKGWSPLSSPPTQAGPAPSGQWPAAWCRVHTGSYTCTASAWSQHASNHTCGRSHRCRRWWRSSPLSHWLWRIYDLWMERDKVSSLFTMTTPMSMSWYWSGRGTYEQINAWKQALLVSGSANCMHFGMQKWSRATIY